MCPAQSGRGLPAGVPRTGLTSWARSPTYMLISNHLTSPHLSLSCLSTQASQTCAGLEWKNLSEQNRNTFQYVDTVQSLDNFFISKLEKGILLNLKRGRRRMVGIIQEVHLVDGWWLIIASRTSSIPSIPPRFFSEHRPSHPINPYYLNWVVNTLKRLY